MLERPISLTWSHRILFTREVFASENHTLVELLRLDSSGRVPKVLIFADDHVAATKPQLLTQISAFAQAHSDTFTLAAPPVILPGGEPCKNDFSLVQQCWQHIEQAGIDRHSCIFVIGGGAILDLVCFAASTAHRGIRHIRFPTTTLSQGDGGVGVKNGVNFFGKKNWVGSFAVPFAVVNDFAFLDSLPDRDRRGGIIEGIKVALIRDGAFFHEIEAMAPALARLEAPALERLIQRSAELHVEHIATSGDPFEIGSARPLDFGHWAAHKLEQVSRFSVSHGEAVAIGMALDLLYSVNVGILRRADAERIIALIERIGFATWSSHLLQNNGAVLITGLEEFREHLGGELTITLVPEIGQKIEVHEMDQAAILAALHELRDRASAPCKAAASALFTAAS
jgi:3-dehydroquinate synthase